MVNPRGPGILEGAQNYRSLRDKALSGSRGALDGLRELYVTPPICHGQRTTKQHGVTWITQDQQALWCLWSLKVRGFLGHCGVTQSHPGSPSPSHWHPQTEVSRWRMPWPTAACDPVALLPAAPGPTRWPLSCPVLPRSEPGGVPTLGIKVI